MHKMNILGNLLKYEGENVGEKINGYFLFCHESAQLRQSVYIQQQ